MLLLAFSLAVIATPAAADTRIKDIVDVENVRDNQLIGYGLVVGLNGTGDRLRNIPFTEHSLKAMLERLGVNIRGIDMRTQNVAAASVLANISPFAARKSVTKGKMLYVRVDLGGSLRMNNNKQQRPSLI